MIKETAGQASDPGLVELNSADDPCKLDA